jgi:hypothetical protein
MTNDSVITYPTKQLALLLLENVKSTSKLATDLVDELAKISLGSALSQLLLETDQFEAAALRLEFLVPARKLKLGLD